MELKEARYILAIAKHQSIGKAAESLYISQPSLSKYLKNLEERLGAPYLTAGKITTIPLTWVNVICTMQSALLPLVISGARNLMILPTRKKGV